jgi:hypothetical protein
MPVGTWALRYLSSRALRFFHEPDTGGAGRAGAEPPAASQTPEVEIGDFPGSELLEGAEMGGPEEFTDEGDFEDPYAEEEPVETEEERVTRETEEAKAKKAAEDAVAAGDEPHGADWPDSAKKRVDKLTAQKGEAVRERDEMKTKVEQLTSENTTLKAAPKPATQAAPVTPENPLANVRETAQLDRAEAEARQRRDWAVDNWDGGSLPMGEGKEPMELTAEQARGMYKRATAMLETHVPARRSFLATEQQAHGYISQRYPDMFDTSKPEGQRFQKVADTLSILKAAFPNWEIMAADAIRGMDVRLKEEADAKAAKETPPKQEPKLAPRLAGAPLNPGTPPKPGKKRPELSPSMTAEELAETM